MGLFDRWTKKKPAEATSRPRAAAGQLFSSFDDPALLDYLRQGVATESGVHITPDRALRNMAVLRACTLISQSIGMLPLNIHSRGEERAVAEGHPVQRLLRVQPNDWQTPSEFKSTLQLHALLYGNAYALIVRGGLGQPLRMVPIKPHTIEPVLRSDYTLFYRYRGPDGRAAEYAPQDILHIRDLSEDGLVGMSRAKLAREAIALALQAETAAARLFSNGMMVGGALRHPGTLSTDAYERLQASMAERYSGSANAHRWMVLEENMEVEKFDQTASDSQHLENRNHQIEEVARAFGVPRPLLMMDDTSWGSGIEQLGLFFVQYALAPWFTAWEEAIGRAFLRTDPDHYAKFNERALLRGSMGNQADYFAKALGSGGHRPWMTVNEVRGLSELAAADEPGADSLAHASASQQPESSRNEPAENPD